MREVTEFFRHTVQSIHEDEEKLDEHLQPIPTELHGAVTRTSPELLRHYEHLGIHDNAFSLIIYLEKYLIAVGIL